MRPSSARLLNILVPVKRTIDYSIRPRVLPGGKGIDKNVKHSMNPFDEIAVEESLLLRSRNPNTASPITITSLTISSENDKETKGAQEVLRHALAMGVDKAVHVTFPAPSPETELEPLGIAKTIVAYIKSLKDGESVDLILCGKQSIDSDFGQVPSMLSALLNWSQATYASKVTFQEAEKLVEVTREIDGGLEEVKCRLPSVVSTDLRLNVPRYASLPNIMKAKKKPITTVSISSLPDLSIDAISPRIETVKVEEPKKRVGGVKVESVDELVSRLKEAGFTAV